MCWHDRCQVVGESLAYPASRVRFLLSKNDSEADIMQARTLLRLTATSLFLAPATHAQFDFAPAANNGAPQSPENVVFGDWDGDGDRDFATATDAIDKISFFFNDGAGGFGTPVNVLTGPGTSPTWAVAGDWDGDGDTDVAVTLKNVNQVRTLVNQGGGNFVLGGTASVGAEPRHMAAGDIDGDGDLDLVTSNRDDNTLTVLGNAGGTFSTIGSFAAGQDPRSVVAFDLDGDGNDEVAVASADTRTVNVFATAGLALAQSATLSVGPIRRPDGLTAADLDGDSDLDLAASTSGNGLNSVSIFTNLGGGSFGAAAHFAVGGVDPSDIVAADFDVDGESTWRQPIRIPTTSRSFPTRASAPLGLPSRWPRESGLTGLPQRTSTVTVPRTWALPTTTPTTSRCS